VHLGWQREALDDPMARIDGAASLATGALDPHLALRPPALLARQSAQASGNGPMRGLQLRSTLAGPRRGADPSMSQQVYGEDFSGNAAENYERYFVPAIGRPLA
jgi:hypothetical protein